MDHVQRNASFIALNVVLGISVCHLNCNGKFLASQGAPDNVFNLSLKFIINEM